MKIISKFNDYYDKGLSFGGFDDSVLYVRETKEIELNYDFDRLYTPFNNYEINSFIVGFCGKVYKGLTLNKREYKPEIHVAYSSDELTKIIKKIDDKEINDYYFNNIYQGRKVYLYNTDFSEKGSQNLFKLEGCKHFKQYEIFSLNSYFENLFEKYNVPLFVIRKNDMKNKQLLVLNSSLKEYQFFKQKEIFTAYQEIEMYLSSGILDNKKEIIQISDRDQMFKKGFDDKSFKKEPTKNRKIIKRKK